MNGIQIRRMTARDLDTACSVIGLAFADNPNTLMLARGDRDRAERMMRAVVRVAKLSRKWSHVLVAVAASDIVEKFGFKVIARADIAGVDNRFMWHDASSRAS
jgi:hypothetical protein